MGSARPASRKRRISFGLAELRESCVMAMSAIRAHKLRSILTLLGIMIGVFSIIVVMTAIRVLQSNIEGELSQLGSTAFVIQKRPEFPVDNEAWEKIRRRKDLTYQQGIALQQKATLAASVGMETGVANNEASSKYYRTNPDIGLIGTTPDAFAARNRVIDQGRSFNNNDLESAARVCVIGSSLSKKLFPHGGGVGDKLQFEGISYHVVGVLEAKGSSMNGDGDNFILIPLTTALNHYGSQNRSLDFLVQARDQATYDDTIEQVRGILRKLRKVPPGEGDDFEIASNDSLINQFRTITMAVRLGAGLISSISLLAAGVGIMNIMLVSVTERTKEIGIRRAIGAKKRNIMTQFIVEAIILCEVGGVFGIVLGITAGNVAAFFLKVTPVFPWDWAAVGLLACSVVGIAFGTYPAYKAANLDPIESLRYE
ncbi:MAG: transporter efflux protein [Verrucomicrobiales bacterium]|nr:transporter efflux protein [Verrucomicrobiales bacterium]MDB6129898.1 transporter efflux protein [Verrucomicrobiales bacterium]